MKKFIEKEAGVLSSSDLKTAKGKFVYWFFFSVLMFCCILTVIPCLWTILTAFKDTQEIYKEFSFFPKNLTWSKVVTRITESWQKMAIGRSMINTIIMSIGMLASTILIDGFGGYVLSRFKPKGTKLVLALILWTLMMPKQLRTVPNYISYMSFPFASGAHGVNILNTYWPICLSAATGAFNVLLFKSSFDAVSISLVEAARIDGAGDMKIFREIVVPLSMPVIIYISINILSGAWSDFFGPYLILKDVKKMTTPVMLYLAKSDNTIQMNTYLMGLIFASIPPFIIFVIFQNKIMGGINVGGVKG